MYQTDLTTKPIQLFAKYKKTFQILSVDRPHTISGVYDSLTLDNQYKHKYIRSENSAVRGGRKEALDKIVRLDQFKHYDSNRDNIADENATTMIGAYLKFGCVSIREFYWAVVDKFGKGHGIINELLWRSYFDHLIIRFPSLLRGQTNPKLTNLSLSSTWHNYQWNKSKTMFNKWAKGKTGVPLVDAAMNQLLTTGFMPNRCRMIVAMYAVRDLKLDWNDCEKHFARYLIDYAPAQNVGNWSWILSYRFKFNPTAQQKRFDPYLVYVNRWTCQKDRVHRLVPQNK